VKIYILTKMKLRKKINDDPHAKAYSNEEARSLTPELREVCSDLELAHFVHSAMWEM